LKHHISVIRTQKSSTIPIVKVSSKRVRKNKDHMNCTRDEVIERGYIG